MITIVPTFSMFIAWFLVMIGKAKDYQVHPGEKLDDYIGC
jgi:hypothetical protein